eukprot:gene19606-54111_t
MSSPEREGDVALRMGWAEFERIFAQLLRGGGEDDCPLQPISPRHHDA